MGNGTGVDYKYLIDKLIEGAEKNLDLQADTLKALHELRVQMNDGLHVKEDILSRVDVAMKAILETRQCQISECIVIIKALDVKLEGIRKAYKQVSILLGILGGMVTLLTIIFSVLKITQ